MTRGKGDGLPERQQAKEVLTDAFHDIDSARPDSILMPKQTVTQPNESISHHITEADLVKLRHGGQMGIIDQCFQLSIGGLLGVMIPVITICVEWMSPAKNHMFTTGDMVTMMVGAAFLSMTVAMGILKRIGKSESVGALCDEISNRPRSGTNGEG